MIVAVAVGAVFGTITAAADVVNAALLGVSASGFAANTVPLVDAADTTAGESAAGTKCSACSSRSVTRRMFTTALFADTVSARTSVVAARHESSLPDGIGYPVSTAPAAGVARIACRSAVIFTNGGNVAGSTNPVREVARAPVWVSTLVAVVTAVRRSLPAVSASLRTARFAANAVS